MKSKFLVLVTLLVLVATVLASCQTAATPTVAAEQPKTEPTKAPDAAQAEPTKAPEATKAPEVAQPAAPGGPVTVTIFVGFGTGTDPKQQEVHKALADDFNASHTDIQVEFVTVPWAERITKFSTMLAGDMAPDIVMPIGVGGAVEFWDEWADLTPLIQADNYDMTRFIGKTAEMHNYGDRGILGLPMCVYPTNIYYNADIFDAAGLDYPPHQFEAAYADGDPWTLDKVVELSAKMSLDGNGNDANSPAFDPTTQKQYGWGDLLWGNNIEYAVKFGDKWAGFTTYPDYKKSALLDPQFVNYMTWKKDNIWTRHIQASSAQEGAFYANSGDPFGSGMQAMTEAHTWMKYAWGAWTDAFNWDIAAVPQGPNGKIIAIVDADTFMMPKHSKHQKEAWEVIKWFYQNEQLQRLIDNYGCFPAEETLAKGWADTVKVSFPNIDVQPIIDALNYLEPAPNHEAWRPEYTKINDIVAKANGEIMTGNNLDVTAVMTAADKEVQALLDDYWK